MSRRGKIACLPEAVRLEVNRRLADAQTGRAIAEWLNDLPEVLAVLKERFNNEPVNESNLSEWRLGGYQDWLDRRDRLDFVREFSAHSAELAALGSAAPAAGVTLLATAKLLQALQVCDSIREPDRFRLLLRCLANVSAAEDSTRRLQAAQERLRQSERKLLLEERRVRALEQRLADARRALQPPTSKGGLTPEALAHIQEALKIL
jgi:hypothetical protein